METPRGRLRPAEDEMSKANEVVPQREGPDPLRPYSLVVSQTSYAGRGVFAAEDIPAGALIEECPILVLPETEMSAAMGTELGNYIFQWGPSRDEGAVALGYGSLFNHSFSPNAMYIRKLHTKTLMFVALEAIGAGTEITVNYNGSPEDRSPVWF